jgi:hypothetical protein
MRLSIASLGFSLISTVSLVLNVRSQVPYLRNVGSLPLENNIKWWFKSGQTSDIGLNWLRSNLDNKIGQLDNISLYVWLGTCDLTFKTNDTVDIRENPKEAIDNLIRNFEDSRYFALLSVKITGVSICEPAGKTRVEFFLRYLSNLCSVMWIKNLN